MTFEYNFVEITTANAESTLPLLRGLHPNLTKAEIDRALNHQYQLFALQKQLQLLGVVGVHIYPHLSDVKRAWIHDLAVVKGEMYSEWTSILLTQIRDRCFSQDCSEIAIHIPIDNGIYHEFLLRENNQPFAYVYEWTDCAWTLSSKQIQLMNNVQCKEIEASEDMASELALLQHFHPGLTHASLIHAMSAGYRLFGLWIDRKLCSIATLIDYPHLQHGTCTWLQDGMTLPIKRYREVSFSLFRYVLDVCLRSGRSTIFVHARIKNKRIHRFYTEAGGRHIANAYKWKKFLSP